MSFLDSFFDDIGNAYSNTLGSAAPTGKLTQFVNGAPAPAPPKAQVANVFATAQQWAQMTDAQKKAYAQNVMKPYMAAADANKSSFTTASGQTVPIAPQTNFVSRFVSSHPAISTPLSNIQAGMAAGQNNFLHAASAAFNVQDVADANGENPWTDFQAWRDSWNHTSATGGDASKPGFGDSLINSMRGGWLPALTLGVVQKSPKGAEFGKSKASLQYQADMQKHVEDTWAGHIVGGIIDTAVSWNADPFMLAGKAAKLSREANSVKSAEDADQAVQVAKQIHTGEITAPAQTSAKRLIPGQQMGLWAKGAQESGARLSYFANALADNPSITSNAELTAYLHRNPDAAPIYGLMDNAFNITDRSQRVEAIIDVLGAGLGSPQARERLIDTVPDLASALTNASKSPEGRDALDSIFASYGGVGALTPASLQARNQAVAAAISTFETPQAQAEMAQYAGDLGKIHDQLQALDEASDNGFRLNQAGPTQLDRSKAASRNAVAKNIYFQNGVYGRGVNVMHWASSQRWRGSVNVTNATLGSQELMDYMVRSKLFTGSERESYMHAWLTAPTREARIDLIDRQLTADMYARVGAKRNMSADAVASLYHENHQTTIASRQYSTNDLETARLNGEDRVIVTSTDGEQTSINRALLETHLADNVHMFDPQELDRMMAGYDSSRPAGEYLNQNLRIAGTGFTDAVDRANHMWRMAVLARPGLLVRTQIDTQGRNLAIMGGTTLVANAMKALGYKINTVLTGEQLQKLAQTKDELHRADEMAADAARIRAHAEGADPQTSIRIPVTTLDARGKALRGYASNAGPGLRAPARVGFDTAETFDGVTHEDANDILGTIYDSPAHALDRADALEAEARKIYDTPQVGNKHLGVKAKKSKYGPGQSASFSPYGSVQGEADVKAVLTPGGVSRSEALTRTSVGQAVKANNSPISSLKEVLYDAYSQKQMRVVEDQRDWRTYADDHPMWSAAWIRATDQYRNSYVGRKVLQYGNISTYDMVEKLMNDPKVLQSYKKLNEGEPLDAWLTRVIDHGTALAPNQKIRDALANSGHMSMEDVEDLIPPVDRFAVQGPHLSPLSAVKAAKDSSYHAESAIGRFVRAMSDKPDLNWGRHPLYINRAHKHFNDLASRQFELHPEWTELPNEVQGKIEREARHNAIQDVHQTMYNTAKFTGAHNSLRFVSPFVGAWQDAMESWTRLFYDDPGKASAFNKVWNLPNRMGIVVDENGNPIAPGQHASQSFLLIPMDFSNNFKTGKTWAVRKDSLNSIFQGSQWWTPGVGPVLQVPAQEVIARQFPELGDSTNPILKSILPFGTPKVRPGLKGIGEDVISDTAPSWARALYSAWSGTDNVAAYQASLNQQVIEARQNGQTPNWNAIDKKAIQQARNTGIFKALSLGIFGLSGQGSNVADFYKKQFDLLQQNAAVYAAQGKTVAEVFQEKFPQAAGLSFGLTTSKTGVQPYLKAFDSQKVYASEIAKNPAYGWFYAGTDNVGGEFSQTAFNAQTNNGTRVYKTKTQIRDSAQAEDGWQTYNNYMALINQRMVELGLHSLDQSGAANLQSLRGAFIQKLANQNPAWWTDYNNDTSSTNLQTFISTVAEPALKDAKLKNRSDIVLMGQYLALRDQALDKMRAAGYTTLGAGAGEQLRDTLNQIGTKYASQNLAFNQMWTRMLQREVLPTKAELLKQQEQAVSK